jgi:hypothetical protein
VTDSGLRRYARPAAEPVPAAPGAAVERCAICGTELDGRHGHLVSLEDRSLRCACPACRLLFTAPGAGGGRLRAVPERYLTDPAHRLTDADWDLLDIPVLPAFLFRNSDLGRTVACYPSPAGVTESLLDLADVARLRDAYPLLRMPAADVEAVYVCRTDRGLEAHLVPIDVCFALAGAIRLGWRGADGGPVVRTAVADFLGDLRTRSRPITRDAG